MNELPIKELLGWCTVLNMGILLISTFFLAVGRGWASKIHSRLFGLDERELGAAYFRYLGNFKILVIVFNLVPYIALCILG